MQVTPTHYPSLSSEVKAALVMGSLEPTTFRSPESVAASVREGLDDDPEFRQSSLERMGMNARNRQ